MEQTQFEEARQDLGYLERDYLGVLRGQATDQYYDDDY